MAYDPSVGTLLMLIPTIIKLVIIGVIIWIGYFFIKEKRRSTLSSSDMVTNPSIYFRIFGVYMKKRTINKVFLILGALPLLVYPGVLIANVMAIASVPTDASVLNRLLTFIFVTFTSSYLLIYLICFAFYFKKRDKNIIVTSIPLIHAALVFIIVFILL